MNSTVGAGSLGVVGGGIGGLGWGSLGLVGCSDGVVYRWWDLGVGGLGVVGRFGGWV